MQGPIRTAIAISGIIGSGKTTAAKFLKYELRKCFVGPKVKVSAMGDYVRRYIEDHHFVGIDANCLMDRESKEIYRKEIITIAESKKIKYGRRYWIEKVIKDAKEVDVLIVPDVRNYYEIEALREKFEKVILINIECNRGLIEDRIFNINPKLMKMDIKKNKKLLEEYPSTRIINWTNSLDEFRAQIKEYVLRLN